MKLIPDHPSHNDCLIDARQHLVEIFSNTGFLLYRLAAPAGHKNPRRGMGFSPAPWAGDLANPCGLAALDSSAETLVEALYAATGGRLLLLTRVERVAVGANVQREVLTRRGPYLEASTAGTTGGDRVVIRMDTLFHLEPHQRYAAT